MSEEMKRSICKSKALGETAEKTAEMHSCTVTEVNEVWDSMKEAIIEYKEVFQERGV